MTEAELKREREERKGREGEMKSIMAFRAYMRFHALGSNQATRLWAKDGTDGSTMKNRRIPEMAKWLPAPGLRGSLQLANEVHQAHQHKRRGAQTPAGVNGPVLDCMHVGLSLGGRGRSRLSPHLPKALS